MSQILISAKMSDTALFGKYFQAMLRRGVYLGPSQFESLFLSIALTDEIIQRILNAHEGKYKRDIRIKVTMSVKVYGIKNCNTMKKAFDFLQEKGVVLSFLITKSKSQQRSYCKGF